MTHAEDKGRMKHIMTFLNGMGKFGQYFGEKNIVQL
jgi:hypothetical protein